MRRFGREGADPGSRGVRARASGRGRLDQGGTDMFTLLINLDSRRDRLERFAARAQEVGLAFERLAACDGSLPRFAEEAARLPPTPIGEVIGPRALACLDSHRLAWAAIAEGHAMGAVFEDDVLIADDMGAILAEDGWVPEDADIVRLETMLARVALGRRVSARVSGREVRRMRSIHMGNAGYVVTRRGAERLLEGTRPVFDTIDRMIFDFRSPFSRGLVTYQMLPAPCVQAVHAGGAAPEWGLSDIDRERYRGAPRLNANGLPVRDLAMQAGFARRRAGKLGRGLWAALRHGARYRRVGYAEASPGARG